MTDTRTPWRLAGYAVLGLALVALLVGWNAASLPESWIERWILHKLPLGSSIVALRNAVDEEGWKTVDEGVTDGGSLVIVDIGRSRLTRQAVWIRFSFDRFGRLIEVEVEKRSVTSASAT